MDGAILMRLSDSWSLRGVWEIKLSVWYSIKAMNFNNGFMRICRVRKRAIIIFATRVGRIMMLTWEPEVKFLFAIWLYFFLFFLSNLWLIYDYLSQKQCTVSSHLNCSILSIWRYDSTYQIKQTYYDDYKKFTINYYKIN